MLDLEDTIPANAHVEHYHSLRPFRFSHLRRLEFSQEKTGQTLTVELEDDDEAGQLVLTFAGVSRFEFLPHNFQPVPLSLEVAYIGARQWQGLNYQVFNSEQDVRLSLYCRDFHASLQNSEQAE